MIILEMQKFNIILIENLQKYQPYHQAKLIFTGEEILRSNQNKIMKQAKFSYFALDKAFEKQIKTIIDQGEKQIEETQNQGQVKTIQKYTFDNKGSPLISK